jgi:hypothetical protein
MDLGYVVGHHGTHRNGLTGERLAQNVQVCSVCFKNFASCRAGERHWDRKKPRGRQCLIPEEVGLISFKNAHGATIYR